MRTDDDRLDLTRYEQQPPAYSAQFAVETKVVVAIHCAPSLGVAGCFQRN